MIIIMWCHPFVLKPANEILDNYSYSLPLNISTSDARRTFGPCRHDISSWIFGLVSIQFHSLWRQYLLITNMLRMSYYILIQSSNCHFPDRLNWLAGRDGEMTWTEIIDFLISKETICDMTHTSWWRVAGLGSMQAIWTAMAWWRLI